MVNDQPGSELAGIVKAKEGVITKDLISFAVSATLLKDQFFRVASSSLQFIEMYHVVLHPEFLIHVESFFFQKKIFCFLFLYQA